VIIAVAVNTDGRREVLGLAVGPSAAEPFWTKFLRSLTRRGLRGVKLVISGAHEGSQGGGSQGLECDVPAYIAGWACLWIGWGFRSSGQ
jgi:putative transposase